MKVRIYRPSKSTMQSGRARTKTWVLEYENETPRGPEPLMGWTAAGDTNNQVRLKFPTQEQAVAYAQEKGWAFTLDPPQDRIIHPRNYTDNFRYIPPKDSATK
ncbi:MAG TPA: ETC complex I subunit [Micavibrio sp.]|nr:ETC complex I subunit [Micavibrio sp.]